MSNKEISWHVTLSINPGCLGKLQELTKEMVREAELESGLLVFERFINAQGTECHVYERYVDSQAAIDHLNTFAGKFSEQFSELIERNEFVVLGSPNAALKHLLDGFGATKYLSHLSSYSRVGGVRGQPGRN